MKKLTICFIPLIFACNNNQKDLEISRLKGILQNLELNGNDSISIYNDIKEKKIYNEVYFLLDSLKVHDNKKYKILLDAASLREIEESEE